MTDINPIQLQKALAGINYPAGRDDVLNVARDNGADDDVITALKDLPDQSYSGPDQVTKAVF